MWMSQLGCTGVSCKIKWTPDPAKLGARWSFLFQLFMLRGLDFSPRFCEIPTPFPVPCKFRLQNPFCFIFLKADHIRVKWMKLQSDSPFKFLSLQSYWAAWVNSCTLASHCWPCSVLSLKHLYVEYRKPNHNLQLHDPYVSLPLGLHS